MRYSCFGPFLALSFALFTNACGVPTSVGSQLKRNATANNASARVFRVRDGSVTSYALVNGTKRFDLNCDDPLEKANLVSATGFPPISITDTTFDNIASLYTAGPSLTCHPGDRPLYKAELDGKTKYFFGATKTATDLYMIGCQGLVEAMGFDLRMARVLDPYFIDNGIFSVPDANDLSCFKGVDVGARLAWERYLDNVKDVVSGSTLDSIVYRVRRPNGMLAALTFSKTGSCDWLTVEDVEPLLMVSGHVPADYAGKSCLLTVTADAGQQSEEQKTLLLRERIKPVVTSTCPTKIDLYLAAEYPDCTLSTTSGTITLGPASSPDCEGVFDFSTTLKKVVLAKTPKDGVECTASFQAKQDDLVSAPLTLTFLKKPAIFKRPVADNKTCQQVCNENGLGCFDGRFLHPYCAGGMCTSYYSNLTCDSKSWWGTETYECRCLTPKGGISPY